jgi:hypothetical protein
MEMTPKQTEMAWHALGLDGRRKVSYRNRYVTGPGSGNHEPWLAMVSAGLAGMRDGKTLPYGGDDMFWLTRAGADAVLRPGEALDPEDFPEEG